jgi:hypothetical protein
MMIFINSALVLFQPGLKHQYIPQVVLPIACTSQMLCPFLPYRAGVKVAFPPQAGFIQQVFGPVA